MTKPMTEAYDHEAEFDANISPHISAILAECKRLRLPLVLAVGYGNAPQEVGTHISQSIAVNMIGLDRTPPSFYAAERVLNNDVEGALTVAYESGLLDAVTREVSRQSVDGSSGATLN